MRLVSFLPLLVLLWAPASLLPAATLSLTAPEDYRVIQRDAQNRGRIPIAGQLAPSEGQPVGLEARLIDGTQSGAWQKLAASRQGDDFTATLDAAGGGWYRLEVRAVNEGEVLAQTGVEHVGVGEVFVVAGQSNSANHGEERQQTATGRVATFTGRGWQPAQDPQPGASGNGGSFMPALGDALVTRLKVPVGFVACGIGATSVREWLPEGVPFPNPPTLESRVQKLPNGEWTSNGKAFAALIARTRPLGASGFRAVLWHQGESDANQKNATRTLAGPRYTEYLSHLIRESRRALGWEAPWFVAQVSYHTPTDPGSEEIRAAQKAVWESGLALPGPDSDQLVGSLREKNGQGVHFSGAGLREHAARWAEKIAPWIEAQRP